MPIIDWDSSYLVGVKQIDLHHQYIFSLLNKTYDNFVNDGPADNMTVLLQELIDYAVYHFFTEEQVMEKYMYPELGQHKDEHDFFTGKVLDMYKDYCEGKRVMTIDLLYFLQEWLVKHIVQSDRKLGLFLDACPAASKITDGKSIQTVG